jgi:hypothetical protein
MKANFKNGTWIYSTSRGHRYQMQYTSPGEPLNNHAPRKGTKRNAGSGCRCEICVGGKTAAAEKVNKKEFKKILQNIQRDIDADE